MYLSRWMLYQLMQSSLLRYLKLAFFPVMACILLAGHASGQTPPRSAALDNNNAWSNCSTAATLTLRAIWAERHHPGCIRASSLVFRKYKTPLLR